MKASDVSKSQNFTVSESHPHFTQWTSTPPEGFKILHKGNVVVSIEQYDDEDGESNDDATGVVINYANGEHRDEPTEFDLEIWKFHKMMEE